MIFKKYVYIVALLTATIFLTTACSDVVLPQGLSELGFYSNTYTIIQTLENKNELSYTEHFMLGVAYKNSNEYKKAIYHFANSCFTERRIKKLTIYPQPVYRFVSRFSMKSYLYNDAVFEIAKGFMYYQEYEYVIKFIDLMKSETSGVYRDAQLLKAEALIQIKQYHQAENVLNKVISKFTDVDSLAWLYIKLASLYEKQDKYSDAVHSYYNLLQVSTTSWQSHIAAKRILQIVSKNPEIALVNDEILLSVEALYNTKNYNDLAQIEDDLLKLVSDSTKKYMLDIVRAKTFCQLNKWDSLKIIYDEYQATQYKYDITAIIVDTLWNSNKKGEALQWLKKLEDTDNPVYKKKILYYKALYDAQRKQTGSLYLDEYVAQYPNDVAAQELLWLFSKNSITNKKSALYYLEKYYNAFGTKGKYADEVCFWLYNLKKDDNPQEAEAIASALVAYLPHSSYTWILLERLSPHFTVEKLSSDFSMAVQTNNLLSTLFTHAMLTYKERDDNKRLQRIGIIKKAFQNIREIHYDVIPTRKEKVALSIPKEIVTRIEHYFSIGYLEGINRELLLYSNADTNDVFLLQYLFGLKYKNYLVSAQGLIQLLKRLEMTENIFLMHDDAIESLLPQPFLECVSQASKKYNVQQPLILAVMKAESLFNPYAESSAGAIGLMQLLIPTAKEIARKTGIEQVNKESLKNPCISIELGTYYISWLLKNLNNNITLVSAAYNAGIGNVLKWNYDNEDMFTLMVPFTETKGYIERIKKFYYQYQLVYDLKRQ
ncbi:MAG: lytic transglycosylase domain-containing protein [Spirochaetes bacterium]|nr:lytic transglycosylase domain-containing protein [Spirochaetota bacterium]